jgi:pSer/pThr/pTyr-binding forkhead associated (FHA) protein
MSSPSPAPEPLAPGSKVKLSVVRGQRVGAAYPVKEGENILGRTGDKPVDVNFDDQERPGQVFAANHHAIIRFENNCLTIQDTGTTNGTYVNRGKVPFDRPMPLKAEDVVQVGTVQFQVKVKIKKATGVAK